MFAAEFLDLCTQTIYWYSKNGDDQYGKPTYATPVSFFGRRVKKTSRLPGGGAQGQVSDKLADSYCWIIGTPNIQIDDRISLEGLGTQQASVMAVTTFPDETGDQFCKVYLGAFTA